MVICPSCRSEQMNGTLFCSECGADLQTPGTPTFDLDNDFSASSNPVMPQPKISSKPQPNQGIGAKVSKAPARPIAAPPVDPEKASPSRRSHLPLRKNFRFMVLNSGRVLECPEQENVIIGRSDVITGDQPDVDLSPDNAIELGVSRRHACVTFKDNQPFLTDLGSTNRTFLNRQVIMKGQPYQINDGDEVRLGNVILKVLFNSNGTKR